MVSSGSVRMSSEMLAISGQLEEASMKKLKTKKMKKKFRIINRGNRAVVALTKESQGTMYYRGE